MKFLLSVLMPFLFTACAHVPPAKPEQQNVLSLSYAKFDQIPGEGWRILGEVFGNYLEAAKLIDKYIVTNLNVLDLHQLRILKWHAGQMYAFSDHISEARQRFIESIDRLEPKDSPILWNDYVLATIAFLDKDLHKLQMHRKAISEGPQLNGALPNLDVVDGLIRCFDKTYREAYSQCRR